MILLLAVNSNCIWRLTNMTFTHNLSQFTFLYFLLPQEPLTHTLRVITVRHTHHLNIHYLRKNNCCRCKPAESNSAPEQNCHCSRERRNNSRIKNKRNNQLVAAVLCWTRTSLTESKASSYVWPEAICLAICSCVVVVAPPLLPSPWL